MKHHRVVLGLVLSLALLALGAAPAAAQEAEPTEPTAEPTPSTETATAAPTVESLIERNLEAKGGREKLEAVDSARLTGTMNMGGMEAPFVFEWKAPDRVRIEFTVQGMTGIQAYDGETGWAVMPFMGKTDPEKMSAEDTEQIKSDADFRGPLFNPEEKGYKVEYLGEEEVEGTPTYKLQVTKENGDVSTIYLDKEYYLEIKQADTRTMRGQQVESETAIGDYKEVEGLMLAHSLDITSAMMPGQSQTMLFQKVELNPEIPDDRFEMPEAPAGEGEPEGDGR